MKIGSSWSTMPRLLFLALGLFYTLAFQVLRFDTIFRTDCVIRCVATQRGETKMTHLFLANRMVMEYIIQKCIVQKCTKCGGEVAAAGDGRKRMHGRGDVRRPPLRPVDPRAERAGRACAPAPYVPQNDARSKCRMLRTVSSAVQSNLCRRAFC